MEVVLLLLGIAGVALVAVPRIQRRSSSGRRATPAAAKRKRAAAAPAVATWTPAAPADDDGWDDDLGWEGVETAPPEARDAWERWRATESPLASEQPDDAPVEPVAELPSVERWRAKAQEEEEWLEDDDGLGWEGESSDPALWNGNGHAPAPEPSARNSGRDEPSAALESAWTATDVAPLPEAEPGRTYALEDDDWDEPVGRPWGAPDSDDDAPAPTPRSKRKLHPVLLLAIYAVAGIGLVVMASTALLGGSADPAPAEPPATRSTPEPVRTPEATPEATGSVADDPAALEEARAAEAKARQGFRRDRTRALAARGDAVDRARAAARREARERNKRAPDSSGPSAPPPSQPPSATPPPASNPAPSQRRSNPVCEFCIG